MQDSNNKKGLLVVLVISSTIIIIGMLLWWQRAYWQTYTDQNNDQNSILPFDQDLLKNFSTFSNQLESAKNYANTNIEEKVHTTSSSSTEHTSTTEPLPAEIIEALKETINQSTTTGTST